MSQDLILYYAPDNASLCVRLALLELEIPFQTKLVDRRSQAQKDPAYLALNPNGLIPTLVTPDGPIYETAAILLWLADQRPDFAFPSVSDQQRGSALARLFWLANTFHPTLRMTFYPHLYAPKSEEILRASSREKLRDCLTQLETAQEPWLSADAPSIIACYFAPMFRWPALYGGDTGWFDQKAFPRLTDFAQRFENRTAMRSASFAEGLGPTPISAPHLPQPPEGTAT